MMSAPCRHSAFASSPQPSCFPDTCEIHAMRREAADIDGDGDIEAPTARRKRKRLPGEDANLRFDEMEAYLQVCTHSK